MAAWVITHDVLGLSASFLAPWSAMLTVHATVYRSFSQGARSIGAAVFGVLVSFVVVQFLGSGAVALGVALLLAMCLSLVPRLRGDGLTAATTALFVIAFGQASEIPLLGDRLIATGTGVAVGVLVNTVIFAPLDERSAIRQIDVVCTSLGDLITDMAEELGEATEPASQEWIRRTRATDDRVVHAWRLVRHTKEAALGNPRRGARRLDARTYEDILVRLEEGIAQTRAIARTIDQATRAERLWDEHFRETWLGLLSEVGGRLRSPDADAADLRPAVQKLTLDLSHHDLPQKYWPVYGSLLDSTANIIDVADDVASSRRVRVAPGG